MSDISLPLYTSFIDEQNLLKYTTFNIRHVSYVKEIGNSKLSIEFEHQKKRKTFRVAFDSLWSKW